MRFKRFICSHIFWTLSEICYCMLSFSMFLDYTFSVFHPFFFHNHSSFKHTCFIIRIYLQNFFNQMIIGVCSHTVCNVLPSYKFWIAMNFNEKIEILAIYVVELYLLLNFVLYVQMQLFIYVCQLFKRLLLKPFIWTNNISTNDKQ